MPAERPVARPIHLAIALVGLLIIQAATVGRVAPLPAAPADAPATSFSAARALERLRRVLGDEAPRPVGTPANARGRARLADELRALGLEPVEQRAWAWSAWPRGARVQNLLARLPGGGGQAVLLLCHHDSVPAGPGASDDGQGVATLLEVARALRAGPPLARPVILLFTDAEEVGLLGARAFVRQHPWLRDVGAVINVEARGTSGPSLMFQTSPGTAWMPALLAEHLPRPLCSSLFPAVYEQLPNDTDLTVFLEEVADVPVAFNFACIGDVDRYHTPHDDLAHLSADTLQHHGENALALTRALAASPLERLRASRERAVYFDLLGLVVLRWPEPWSLALALVALAGVGAAVALLVRAGAARGAEVGWGLAGWAGGLAATGLLGLGLQNLLAAALGSPSPWAAAPLAGHLLFWGLAGSAAGAVHALAAPRAGAWGAWAGAWLGWALLGLVVAVALPGGCFVAIAPALVAAAAGLAGALRPALAPLAWLAPCLAAACLWLPIARGLEASLGLLLKVPVALAAALVVGTLAPLLPAAGRGRGALPGAAALVALGALVVVVAAGPHSADRPQRLNIVLEEDADARAARWTIDARAGRPPAALLAAGGLAAEGGRFVGPAPLQGLPPPELDLLEQGPGLSGLRLRARVRSPRGAWMVRLRFDAPAAVTVDGQRSPLAREVDLLGLPPEGLEVTIDLPAAWSGRLTLVDASFGLPPAGAPLLQARPAWAVPSQQGDLTTVTRRWRRP